MMNQKDLLPQGRVSIVIDAGWGSSGKGHSNAVLGYHCQPDVCACNNGPNSGHSTICDVSQYSGVLPSQDSDVISVKDGKVKIVLKCLPSSAMTSDSTILLMPDAVIKLNRFLEEVKLIPPHRKIFIHPRVAVVTDDDVKGAQITGHHLAGTQQGTGHAIANKALRKPGVKLAKDYPELLPFVADTCELIRQGCRDGRRILFEIPQGFDLSLNHGLEYPYLTSRDITIGAAINSCGVSHKDVGNVFGCARVNPIRVGNIEGGFSGPCYDDQRELTWEEVTKNCGADRFGISLQEITTVTKRVRRVFSFSRTQIEKFCQHNKPDYLFVNFVSYLDYNLYGKTNLDVRNGLDVSKLDEFGSMVINSTGVPILAYGTGPHLDEVIWCGSASN
jgi:adenylosuccinate synthase